MPANSSSTAALPFDSATILHATTGEPLASRQSSQWQYEVSRASAEMSKHVGGLGLRQSGFSEMLRRVVFTFIPAP